MAFFQTINFTACNFQSLISIQITWIFSTLLERPSFWLSQDWGAAAILRPAMLLWKTNSYLYLCVFYSCLLWQILQILQLGGHLLSRLWCHLKPNYHHRHEQLWKQPRHHFHFRAQSGKTLQLFHLKNLKIMKKVSSDSRNLKYVGA